MYYAYGDNKYLIKKTSSIEQSIKYLPENTVKVIDELTNDEIITIEYSIQIIKKFNKSDFGDKPSDYKYLSLSLDFNSTNNHKQLSIGKKRLKNLINDSELRPDFSYAPAEVTKKFNINGEEKTYSDFYKIGDSKFLERTRPVSIDISNETDIYKTNPFSYTYNLTTANVNEDENGNAIGIKLGDEETIDIVYTLSFRVSYPKLKLNFNIKNVNYTATYQIYNPYYITVISVLCQIGRIYFMLRFISKFFNIKLYKLFPTKLILKIVVPSVLILGGLKYITIFLSLGSGIYLLLVAPTQFR
jgi:hypothetical protein